MLHYRADLKTLLYLVVTTGLLFVQWTYGFYLPVFILSLFMGIAVAVIAHNHNHVPTWKARWMNTVMDYWITLFYGFPAFAWIPTHNRNHHQLNNREGDHTITYRISERNNLWTLLSYPTISSFYQQRAIYSYLRDLRQRNKQRFWESVLQYVALVLFIGGALLIDWQKALLYIVIPHQTALFSILVFNYVQHVHANEESEWDHSRNFVGPLLNFLLFNNGYHTIHHERANIHWSKTPEEHAKIVNNINPVLNEPSFWWYIIRSYFLAPLFPKLGTRSMRLERLRSANQRVEPLQNQTPVLHA